MPWFRVDDKLHDHRKSRAAGPAAMGVWLLAGSWSADNLTDGFIPAAALPRWGRQREASKLVEVGLWHEDSQDGEKGWRFHEWMEHQPSRAETLEKREKRAVAGRNGGLASGRSRRQAKAKQGASSEPGVWREFGSGLADVETENDDIPSSNQPERSQSLTSGSNIAAGTGGIPEANAKQVASTTVEPPTRPVPSLNTTTRARKRASRLDDDWNPTPDDLSWASLRVPGVNHIWETEKFRNYWQAKSGQQATKLDWSKTWRNWLLSAAERLPQGRKQPVRVAGQPLYLGD